MLGAGLQLALFFYPTSGRSTLQQAHFQTHYVRQWARFVSKRKCRLVA